MNCYLDQFEVIFLSTPCISTNTIWILNLPIDFKKSLVNMGKMLYSNDILVNWTICGPSKLQKIVSEPWSPEFVSIHLKLLPVGGRLVAPEKFVRDDDLFDFINFHKLPIIFLSLRFITPCFRREVPMLGCSIIVVSVMCILLHLARMYVSFPTDNSK